MRSEIKLGYFKFLDAEHIGYYTEHNTLQFSRLHYFRILEVATGDRIIGDSKEGYKGNFIPHLEMNSQTSPEEKAHWHQNTGLGFTGEGTFTLTNVPIHSFVECYILSFSYGDFEELKRAMCTEAEAQYAYDACFEIKDMQVLCDAIENEGLVDGRPLKELFTVHCCKVRYEQTATNNVFGVRDVESGNPCVKDISYADQSEFRIILSRKSDATFPDQLPDRARVQLPDLSQHLEARKIEGVTKDKSLLPRNFQEQAAIIRSGIIQFREFESQQPWPTIGLNNEETAQFCAERQARLDHFFHPYFEPLLQAYWVMRQGLAIDTYDYAFMYGRSSTNIVRKLDQFLERFDFTQL
jgi:hypothetical protein